jgi:cytochrome c oxidase subunit 4
LSEHIVSRGVYAGIGSTLLIMTGVTVYAAYVDLNKWNIVIALGIATFKASLVILYFMHARYSPKRTQLVIVAAVFWLGLLLFMTMADYVTRKPEARRIPPTSSQLFLA